MTNFRTKRMLLVPQNETWLVRFESRFSV